MDVRTTLKQGMAQLRETQVPSHTLAAELLLMHVLGRERAWIYAHPEESIEPLSAQRYFQLVAQRAAGEPTQYIVGHQEFWGREFEVTPDVLIPRPETEHVIEVALERIGQCRPLNLTGKGLRIGDVGTGSGCLAVTLACELPDAELYATDISAAALAIAQRNAARHGVASRIRFQQCNLLDGFLHQSRVTIEESRPFHLIVSNPPYVAGNEAASLPREVRQHEPAAALFAGERGLDFYAPLIAQAAELLASGGHLVLELSYNALDAVRPLVEASAWTRAGVTRDLAGIPRVLAATRV